MASQSALLERRIIELLTTTNLTFKEIIAKLDGEQLSASIGIIRRINRDNRYRRPRYDSKLTPAQRESLVDELRDHQGVKPNLSLLAKRYGVCHGSVWYWWDKLNRIRRCESPAPRYGKGSPGALLRRSPASSLGGGPASPFSPGEPQLAARAAAAAASLWLHYPRHELIGRVRVVARDTLELPIELPILMFTKQAAQVAPESALAAADAVGLFGTPRAMRHLDSSALVA